MIFSPSKKGLSIVEVTVALAIMSILTAIIVQFFVTQSRAATLQKAINEASEAGRTALSLITWDLQNAGYRVRTTSTNPAINALPTHITGATTSSYYDVMEIRFRDDSLATPVDRRVLYTVDAKTGVLERAEYDEGATPTQFPSVASIVAMNVRYETRENQYVTPVNSGSGNSCPSGTTEIYDGSGNVINCSVDWVLKDKPERLVRQVKVQLLARSETTVPGHKSSQASYSFDGANAVYKTEPGYVYRMTEQTVIVPNLGR